MRQLMALAAIAMIGLPLALATRSERAPAPSSVEPTNGVITPAIIARRQTSSADTGSVRALMTGIRGANAIQCELLLQAFNGWSTDVPDRELAWNVTRRLWDRIDDSADIAWLGEQVRGADPCVARASIRVLGRSRSPAARTVLVNALTDDSPRVRRLAAIGIGFREDSTINGQLIRLLRDGDPRVRAAAAWALGAVH